MLYYTLYVILYIRHFGSGVDWTGVFLSNNDVILPGYILYVILSRRWQAPGAVKKIGKKSEKKSKKSCRI